MVEQLVAVLSEAGSPSNIFNHVAHHLIPHPSSPENAQDGCADRVALKVLPAVREQLGALP